MTTMQSDKQPIAPVISDDAKRSIELMEKLNKGEISDKELEAALGGEPPVSPLSPMREVEHTELENDDISKEIASAEIEVDEEADEDIEPVKAEPAKRVSKSRKQRDRQKENMLMDKMRIEQLELEKQDLAYQMQTIRQQQLQQQQWIEQSNKHQQESLVAASAGRIDQLERELAEAASLYDSPRIAKINSELVKLRVQQELDRVRIPQQTQQPYAQPQQPQYNNQQRQVSPEEALVQRRILDFASKPQNKWTDLEFFPDASPRTEDARALVGIINEVKAERGDWRTASFWDIVEERAAEVLPHKYGGTDTPKVKSPPVGTAANKGGAVSNRSSTNPIAIEAAEIIKLAMSQERGLSFKTEDERRKFIKRTIDGIKKKRGLA